MFRTQWSHTEKVTKYLKGYPYDIDYYYYKVYFFGIHIFTYKTSSGNARPRY
jgi:hypothetical protein